MVASFGGHWIQLMRMRSAFAEHDCYYLTTNPEIAPDYPTGRFFTVPDASRWNKLRLLYQLLKMATILLRVRPQVVISTGAAPGYFALRIGKLLGARTIWVDSIANAEELSMAGRIVQPYADLWLTQWEHLARPEGPQHKGSVL